MKDFKYDLVKKMYDFDFIGWIFRIDWKLKMDVGKVMNNVVMVCLICLGILR